jgi:signal transduction histidine kinase/CheY-like chemotaxis protein
MAAPSEPQSTARRSLAGHPAPLSARLVVLAASGLLPLAIVVALALAYLSGERQLATQRSALALSRALATAVDAELRSTVAVLRALSQDEALQRGDLERFYRSSVRVAVQQGWRSVVLADDTGRAILRSRQPFGAADPRPVDPESMAQAVATQRPTVGRVVAGGTNPGLGFAVRLPVRTEDNRVYILSAVLGTEQILTVLRRQAIPTGWVVGVFDHHLQRVARSRDNASGQPSPSLRALLSQGKADGLGITRTLEGVASHTGYTRLAESGWVVAVGIPSSEASAATYGPSIAILLGLLGSLGLAAFLGWYFAGRVSQPIGVLKEAAAALGRGETVAPGPLAIEELDEVARALAQASQQREAFMRELTQAQLEREALLRQVTEALRAAEEAGRAKDQFLAVLGHELRNPLAPIAMALQLMAVKGEPATAAQRRVIERQVAHMTRLVDDLLDLSRITGKRLAMRLAPVRLAEVIEQAADAIRPLLEGRTLRVEIESPAAAAWVSGDEARLGQVFNNLLGNALKFTTVDGRIDVHAAVVAGAVEVEVRDDGLGMSPEVVQHAFEPFFQERQGGDRSRGGLGLGLTIVKSLVEMHGGSVAAASDGPGRGSRLLVRLPLAAAGDVTAPAVQQAAGGSGKVLVVDDNRDAADTTASLLELSGYQTRVAYDPAAALALLDDYVPGVAILDIGLPGMSGYELARRVRAHPNGAACLLIALTGYGQSDDVAQALRNGFAAHLAKPVPADVLLQRLGELMPANAD